MLGPIPPWKYQISKIYIVKLLKIYLWPPSPANLDIPRTPSLKKNLSLVRFLQVKFFQDRFHLISLWPPTSVNSVNDCWFCIVNRLFCLDVYQFCKRGLWFCLNWSVLYFSMFFQISCSFCINAPFRRPCVKLKENVEIHVISIHITDVNIWCTELKCKFWYFDNQVVCHKTCAVELFPCEVKRGSYYLIMVIVSLYTVCK